MTVHEKLEEIINWSGKTQKEIAEQLDVSTSLIHAYVNGRVAVSVDMAYKLADVLGVTPWTLLNAEPLPVSPLDLSQKEETAIAKLRALSQSGQDMAFDIIDRIYRHEHLVDIDD